MIQKLIQYFSPNRLPMMARPTYVQELKTVSTIYISAAMMEGAVIGVLAKKVFDVTDLQLALITAAPMFANLTSFLWEYIARGKRKIPLISTLFLMILFGVAAIGMLPISPVGKWELTGLMIAIRCLTAGIVTLRSIVWRHNYPTSMRSRITGRTTIVVQTMLLITPQIAGFMMDLNQQSFRILYPSAAVISLFGVYSFSKIRLRREKELLLIETSPELSDRQDTPRKVWPGARMWYVLKDDRLFRHYLVWQFFAGVSNMMVEPVFIKIIAEQTDGLQYEYILSNGIAHTLPVLLALCVTPLWAHYLDRVHVVKFRVSQSWIWCIAQSMIAVGVLWATNIVMALIIFMAARILLGIARGGGMLAWNLGHLDFARRDQAALYMGIHVTLTGIRGAIAPLIGMILYSGLPELKIGQTLIYTGFNGIGGYVFFIAAFFGLVAAGGFYALERMMRREGYSTDMDTD